MNCSNFYYFSNKLLLKNSFKDGDSQEMELELIWKSIF